MIVISKGTNYFSYFAEGGTVWTRKKRDAHMFLDKVACRITLATLNAEVTSFETKCTLEDTEDLVEEERTKGYSTRSTS